MDQTDRGHDDSDHHKDQILHRELVQAHNDVRDPGSSTKEDEKMLETIRAGMLCPPVT